MPRLTCLWLEFVKVSRPGFWPTHLWFFVLPFGRRDLFGEPAFWAGCVYVCFPLGLLLYGWNDLGDAATDRANSRKDSWLFGARPDAAVRRRLPAVIACVQLPFLALFIVFLGWRGAGWFALLIIANALYNGVPAPAWAALDLFAFKRWAALDLLNQVGYLLVFVLASWLGRVPQLAPPVLVFSTLFAMHSHLFGQLMDIDEDRRAGRRGTAVLLGSRAAKLLLVTMLAGEAALAWGYFRGDFVGWFMAAGALFFLGDALLGPPRYPPWFAKAFFVAWNITVLGTMHFIWRYGVFV